MLAEFIERGWMEPSDSEWASPAFIVPKKEKGEWRLVVDYRGLNKQTEHDSYLLPVIVTIPQKQQKKRIFTVLDLKHGCHHIGSSTEDMTEDELIEAHEKDLRRVLSELDKHHMVCKPTKASLFVRQVEFAGHVVRHGQCRPMTGMLASLHHWDKLQTISELQSFMGFCNYYSGYVRMYAELWGPLHKMLQVGKFDGRKGSKKKLAWTPEAEDASSRLKERLLGQLGPFLVDPNKGFVLRTDTSDYAVGAVLEQVRKTGRTSPCRFGAGSWQRANVEP